MQKKGKNMQAGQKDREHSKLLSVEIQNWIFTLRKYISAGVEHFKVLVLKYFPA